MSDLEHVTLGNDHTMLMRGLLFLFYRWQSESQRLGDLLKVTQAVNGKDYVLSPWYYDTSSWQSLWRPVLWHQQGAGPSPWSLSRKGGDHPLLSLWPFKSCLFHMDSASGRLELSLCPWVSGTLRVSLALSVGPCHCWPHLQDAGTLGWRGPAGGLVAWGLPFTCLFVD